MPTRADTLEKFIGRRGVSCLGFFFLLIIVTALALLAWSHFAPQQESQPPQKSAPTQP